MIKLFSVKDHESQTYLNPIPMMTKRDAIYSFKLMVNDEETQYNRTPQDFALVYLGEYDQHSAKFKLLDSPEIVIHATDLIEKKDK